MKKSLLEVLCDPNDKGVHLGIFAHEVNRGGEILKDIASEDLENEDDIKSGFVINLDKGNIFPINEYVLLMFSDSDLDCDYYIERLESAARYAAGDLSGLIEESIKRVKSIKATDNTQWNTEEMEYYDKDVATPELRASFLEDIKKNPLWHIYIERERYFKEAIDPALLESKYVFEIGCGNARTISYIVPPGKHKYHYVGTDISPKRLMLAKQVIPEGDFVQCSAYNLPFREGAFKAAIAFGVLHHLPDPEAGLKACISCLESDGYFIIHEPLKKPRQLIEGTKLGSMMERYEHSEHDNEINIDLIMEYIKSTDTTILSIHYSVSMLRTIVSKVVAYFSVIRNSRKFWNFLIKIDGYFIRLFCRKSNVLGPGAVFLVLKKNR